MELEWGTYVVAYSDGCCSVIEVVCKCFSEGWVEVELDDFVL